MTNNFTRGITGVGVLSKFTGTDFTVVDIGVNGNIEDPKVLKRKVSNGTNNIAVGPAMTRDQAIRAIEVGIEIVDELVDEGCNLLGAEEMGIGNTTTSAAVLSVISGESPDIAVGRGAGLTKEQFENKTDVVKRAINVNKPDKNDVTDVFISSAAALCAY